MVVDHNDNNPICSSSTVELCINESHPLSTEITTMNCTDPDSTISENAILGSTPDNNVVYGFSGGNINRTFAIDPVRYPIYNYLLIRCCRLLGWFHWLNQWTEKPQTCTI